MSHVDNVDVAFVLPGIARVPVGGFRVVYEYANMLADRGHSITVVHMRMSHLRKPQIHDLMMRVLYRAFRRIRPKWFDLDSRVSVVNEYHSDFRRLPRARVIVATSVATAPIVGDAVKFRDVGGIYLIQHLEDFTLPLDEVVATWQLPLRRVVVSKWLEGELLDRGLSSDLIENGVDRNTFCPAKEEGSGVGLLAMVSEQEFKRTDLVVEVYRRLSNAHPGLRLRTFGACDRPDGLPAAVEHVREPSRLALAELYRSSRIYLCTSDSEGFGLPALEAMASGCAVVSTDNGGVPGFAGDAVHVVPVGSSEELLNGVELLLSDSELCDAYRARGLARSIELDTERACDRLEQIIMSQWLARES